MCERGPAKAGVSGDENCTSPLPRERSTHRGSAHDAGFDLLENKWDPPEERLRHHGRAIQGGTRCSFGMDLDVTRG